MAPDGTALEPRWNVVVTVYDGEYRRARRLLATFGEVAATEFRNVIVLQVPDADAFLARMQAEFAGESDLLNCVSRVVPAKHVFCFDDAGDFQAKARSAAAEWLPALAGRSFHVRIHRRGLKGRLSSHAEEGRLAAFLLERLQEKGAKGCIRFSAPDAILAIETLGHEAGLSLWTREALDRSPFLGLERGGTNEEPLSPVQAAS